MGIDYRKAVNLKPLFDEGSADYEACCAKARAMLDAEQRNCTVRMLSTLRIRHALEAVNDRFDGITKKALEGTEIWIDVWAQAFPSAYRYIPYSTQFHAAFHRGSWWLVSVYRDVCKRPTKEHYCKLSESAAAALIASRTEW